MSSVEICEILDPICQKYFPDDCILSIPIADGGEGTVEAFNTALSGTKKTMTVKGPLGEMTQAEYILLDTESAVVEMASAAGLPLVKNKFDVMKANTYGVGQILLKLLMDGIKTIYLGLGGSATNDGGAGAASALGVRFLDSNGKPFVPSGGTLKDINEIDLSSLPHEVKDSRIILLCDINNSVCGTDGAVAIFSRQKGASQSDQVILESGMINYVELLSKISGLDIFSIPGGGAAGGMAAGFTALFHSEQKMGIDVILDLSQFEDKLKTTRFIMTGEGKIDQQSLSGKAVVGIARRAKKQNVPVFALVGDIEGNMDEIYEQGITGIFSINRQAIPYAQAKSRARSDLVQTADNLLRVLSSIGI